LIKVGNNYLYWVIYNHFYQDLKTLWGLARPAMRTSP